MPATQTGKRIRDYGVFRDPDSPMNALLVESGQHLGSRSAVVSLETTLRFLHNLDAIDPALVASHLSAMASAPQHFIEVNEEVQPKAQHLLLRNRSGRWKSSPRQVM